MSASTKDARGRPPRRKPPWWPDTETWPPAGRGAWEHGPPWGRHRGMRRPFGCLLLVFALLATGLLTLGIWTVAAIVGLVSAPPIVVAAGTVALALVTAGTVLAVRGMRRFAAPFDDLIEGAARIESGDYSSRVPEQGPGGVRSLIRAFNEMAARLEATEHRRQTFLADVTHELRTPLTVIQGQLEAIRDGVYPSDEEHVAPVLEQIRALEHLVDDLRTVALVEAGGLTLARGRVDLGGLVDEVVAVIQGQADAAGIELRADVELRVPTAAVDPARMRQVLGNLLANALRHTPRGGHVTVSVASAGEQGITLAVRDDGSGIPADLLHHVFERFVRGPGSTGSGLGLAIARDLVTAHGGTIAAESVPGQGTTVRVTLPLGSGA